jgi:histidine phosphotransferase ChpT
MTQHTEDLAALIGSRICHDLISPIGAVSNGLELLELCDHDGRAEMALVNDSAANASARVRLLRLAFGQATGRDVMPLSDLSDIWADLNPSGRLRLEVGAQATLPRPLVRMVALGALCLQDALPQGGRIRVETGERVTLTGTGPRISAHIDHWAILTGSAPPDDLRPAQVQFLLLPNCAESEGRACAYSLTSEQITLSF